MSVFNSISVAVLIVLLAAGLITGLSVSGVDILNPQTAAAEANQMNVETNHQEAIYEQQERVVETETDAKIKSIEREQGLADAHANYNKEMLLLDVRNNERAAATWLLIATWVGGALSISLIVSTFLWVGSKAIANIKLTPINPKNNQTRAARTANNRRDSEESRKAKIAEARYREHSERLEKMIKERDEQIELMVRMQSVSDPTSLGKTKYNDLPLAD